MKIELYDTIEYEDVSLEDGGQAKIFSGFNEKEDENDNGLFIRIQSWCENGKEHPMFDSLIGKKLKITIEEIK